MKFFVELDHRNSGRSSADDGERAAVERAMFHTLAKAEQLVKAGHILAGGPVAGRIALRFVAEVESALQLDLIVSSLPLWAIADTRVTPLIEFGDRSAHMRTLLSLEADPLSLIHNNAAAVVPS